MAKLVTKIQKVSSLSPMISRFPAGRGRRNPSSDTISLPSSPAFHLQIGGWALTQCSPSMLLKRPSCRCHCQTRSDFRCRRLDVERLEETFREDVFRWRERKEKRLGKMRKRGVLSDGGL